jgi:hypothetical protein
MHKALDLDSKSPFTKLKEVISNCSIPFYKDTFVDNVTFRALESN